MIVTRMHLPRRTVLRGVGVSIALPVLDAMVPALTPVRVSAAAPVRRMGALYVPNGVSMSQTPGVNVDYWTPPSEGRLEPSPILQPLADLLDRALVVSGLDSAQGWAQDAGPHPRVQTSWLTATRARRADGAGIGAGTSMDQIAAQHLGRQTQLPSLELAIESIDLLGACQNGYSCAYTNTISWRNPTTPVPMENNPRAVFERLFGGSDTTDVRTRLADIRRDRSILDLVGAELARFQKGIGAADQAKVDQYFDSIRDVERRIQKSEAQANRELPVLDRPRGIPETFDEHVTLMFDLLTIAFQCDITRVFTFLMSREQTSRSYPEIGIAEGHHDLSHHADNREKLAKLAKLNAYHMKLFGAFVEKLKATADGDGTLLDHTVLLYGSGMGDPNQHVPLRVPSLVINGSGIAIDARRHLRYPQGTPLANLQLALLQQVGVPLDRFGDSTEVMAGL